MDKRGSGAAVAFAGVSAACVVVTLLLCRLLPTGQLGFAAAASLFICAAMLKYGAVCALGAYVTAAILGSVLVPGIPAWLFALFFGYYPIIKLAADRRFQMAVSFLIKTLVFAAAYTGLAISGILPKPELPVPELFLPLLFFIVFIVFDIGYSKLIRLYFQRFGGNR